MVTKVFYLNEGDGNKQERNHLNPLSEVIRRKVYSSIRQAITDPDVTSIILFGGGNHFSAGADITEFSKLIPADFVHTTSKNIHNPSLIDLCTLIESSNKPVLAAISGICFGGGLELALSCHFRIASHDVQLALPEVKIGLIPGAGGTQRLPRLTKNIIWSLDFITSGRTIDANEARKVGLLDDISIGTPLALTQKWALFAETMRDLTYRTVSMMRVIPEGDVQAFERVIKECAQIHKMLPAQQRGGLAAHSAVKAIRASFEQSSFHAGIEIESRIFFELLQHSSQGRALRYAFFTERSCKKINMTDAGSMALQGHVAQMLLQDQATATIGVVGAGLMGSGIAICFLRAGYHVVLVDSNPQSLKNGLQQIRKAIETDVEKKRISSNQASSMLNGHLHPSEDMASSRMKECVLVVEAVFENLKIKQNIFQQLDAIVSHPSALLLTNTSTLNIDEVMKMVRPERRPYCAGMHFFSPAHVMKLVEIVKSSNSSPQTLLIVKAITNKKLQKIGVTVGNCDGFVGNRMIEPYSTEAIMLLHEGSASVVSIDQALTEFGMALGPLQMGDLAGNDIGYLIRREKGLVDDLVTGRPGPNLFPGMRYSSLADELVTKLGRVGQKKMKGWYDYDINVGGGRRPIPSKEVSDFINSFTKGLSKQALSHNQIVERILFPLINEGFKVLEEGIAQSPDDIDIIYLYGYGFPSWRGGPMFYASYEVGLSYLLTRLKEFHALFPGSNYFVPSQLLYKCVEMKLTVHDYFLKGYNKLNVGGPSKL